LTNPTVFSSVNLNKFNGANYKEVLNKIQFETKFSFSEDETKVFAFIQLSFDAISQSIKSQLEKITFH
jgi:hypothetical protein